MNPFFRYCLEVTAISGLLCGYYRIGLRNRLFHQYNRFYLLVTVVLSLAVPILNIPLPVPADAQTPSVLLYRIQEWSAWSDPVASEGIASQARPWWTFLSSTNWLAVLYWSGVMLLFFRMVMSLAKIFSLARLYPIHRIGKIRVLFTEEREAPFSFFNWVFWKKSIDTHSVEGQQIMRHELYHVRQSHSADIIFLELATAFCWLNPFFHFIKSEVRTIHEFLADDFASRKVGKGDYAALLLGQVLQTHTQLIQPFFHIQIKRRIAMITNPVKTSHRYLRKLLVLPLVAALVLVFAFRIQPPSVRTTPVSSGQKITVVIDPGHGGMDRGALAAGGKYHESDITLQIAQAVRRLGPAYNVDVVLTRERDELPGNAASREEGLRQRIEIANRIHPNAFVSIHIDARSKAGTQAKLKKGQIAVSTYISRGSAPRSERLAAIIGSQMMSLNGNNDVPVLRREASIYVLDKNPFPAVLIQAGDMMRDEDIAFLSVTSNQELLARHILEGLLLFDREGAASTNSGHHQEGIAEKQRNGSDLPGTTLWMAAAGDSIRPLIVVDGKPLPGISAGQLDTRYSPEQIESVQILKGDTATRKYGPAGQAGVIEVHLKKTGGGQQPTVSPEKLHTKDSL